MMSECVKNNDIEITDTGCCCAKTQTDDKSSDRNDTERSCENCRHKERSEKEYKDLINRLNRIEGQIRGIRGMVERSAYCPDILVQVSAANAALNSFNKARRGWPPPGPRGQPPGRRSPPDRGRGARCRRRRRRGRRSPGSRPPRGRW